MATYTAVEDQVKLQFEQKVAQSIVEDHRSWLTDAVNRQELIEAIQALETEDRVHTHL